jgi:hypothetical protein
MKRTFGALLKPIRLTLVTTGAAAALSLPIVFGASVNKAHAAESAPTTQPSCSQRYNTLLQQAKSALAKQDRNGAIRALIAARSQLLECHRRDRQDSSTSSRVALNGDSFKMESFSD